jgi:hypothetical protein
MVRSIRDAVRRKHGDVVFNLRAAEVFADVV